MAKAFNEKERQKIKEKLIELGKEHFCRYGLKKTSISDLTKQAGIAQGSFYLFFKSKEELLFEILEIEETRIKEGLMQELFAGGSIDCESFKRFLKLAFAEAERNPIIKMMFDVAEYEAFLRKLPQEKIEKHIQEDSDLLTPLVVHMQSQGLIGQMDPKVIGGMLRSIFTIAIHKREIGEDIFINVVNLLIDTVSEGLFKKGDL